MFTCVHILVHLSVQCARLFVWAFIYPHISLLSKYECDTNLGRAIFAIEWISSRLPFRALCWWDSMNMLTNNYTRLADLALDLKGTQ